MVAKSEKRHETLVAFCSELARVASAFRWFVDDEGAVLGRFIDCTRIKPFSPMCAVSFMGTGRMEHDDKVAALVCGLQSVEGEIWVASTNRNNTELRRWILDAVGLVKER